MIVRLEMKRDRIQMKMLVRKVLDSSTFRSLIYLSLEHINPINIWHQNS